MHESNLPMGSSSTPRDRSPDAAPLSRTLQFRQVASPAQLASDRALVGVVQSTSDLRSPTPSFPEPRVSVRTFERWVLR